MIIANKIKVGGGFSLERKFLDVRLKFPLARTVPDKTVLLKAALFSGIHLYSIIIVGLACFRSPSTSLHIIE